MTVDARDRSVDPICVRIRDAVRLTGLSRSRLYELMKSGDIEFVKVGSSTLIPYDGLRAFIERCRGGASPSPLKNGAERRGESRAPFTSIS